ncbi:MAG TPA: MOSC N-terminal beta barrel domain-containing protein, partial [Burkholderiales bacterium]|nr:MOSC N-terminal beta barrel domain-containing protein [Burkholderiales bacterium]
MRITALAIYPLKGAAAVALEALEIDALGPVGDRRYCLARPGGRVFTQRDDASLARLRATLQGEGLSLSYDGEQVEVPPEAFDDRQEIRVWSRSATACIATARINTAV